MPGFGQEIEYVMEIELLHFQPLMHYKTLLEKKVRVHKVHHTLCLDGETHMARNDPRENYYFHTKIFSFRMKILGKNVEVLQPRH